jgi:hypothetical protein
MYLDRHQQETSHFFAPHYRLNLQLTPTHNHLVFFVFFCSASVYSPFLNNRRRIENAAIVFPLWLARNASFPGRCYSNSSYKQLPYQHTPLRSPDACVFNYVCIRPHMYARFAYLHGAVSLDTNSRASLNTCTVVHPCLHVRKHIP